LMARAAQAARLQALDDAGGRERSEASPRVWPAAACPAHRAITKTPCEHLIAEVRTGRSGPHSRARAGAFLCWRCNPQIVWKTVARPLTRKARGIWIAVGHSSQSRGPSLTLPRGSPAGGPTFPSVVHDHAPFCEKPCARDNCAVSAYGSAGA
jgi:hypothetical protein